ncbi:hypothetical protein QE428_000068 [Microbacterium sp. SORGH_AS 505]|nr:hypothetical protein [Microbacterium sp. SORGH_AS_0505]
MDSPCGAVLGEVSGVVAVGERADVWCYAGQVAGEGGEEATSEAGHA